MRFKRLKKEEEPGFSSIAPLIDIVFLLLIFFMAATHSSSATGLSVSLPETGRDYSAGDISSVRITIAADGSVMLMGIPVEPASLREELERGSAGEGPFNILLEADKDVKHGTVVEIMDAAKLAGARAIVIAAYLNKAKEQ
jgi:biopolymer transport protein ExbD